MPDLPRPFAVPIEFDDIDDALKFGHLDEEAARVGITPARLAAGMREQVARAYTDNAPRREPTGLPIDDLEWALEFLAADPDRTDTRAAISALRVARQPGMVPTPHLTRQQLADGVEDRNMAAWRAESVRLRQQAAAAAQLDLFADMVTAAQVYDEPTEHPEFESMCVLISEFALERGRWPRVADVDAEALPLPAFEETAECGGFVAVVEACKVERPVEGTPA